MNIPTQAFVKNDPSLPHMADVRRPVGRYQTGGREDGTGYITQVIQHPVVCAVDIYERNPTAGKEEHHVTSNTRAVKCPDCRQRMEV